MGFGVGYGVGSVAWPGRFRSRLLAALYAVRRPRLGLALASPLEVGTGVGVGLCMGFWMGFGVAILSPNYLAFLFFFFLFL